MEDPIARILNASIAREQNKALRQEFNTIKELATSNKQMAAHIVKIEAELKKYRAVMTISVNYLEEPLQYTENLLKTDPSLLNYEALADYSKLSRFMEAAHGRKGMAEVAEKRMREMTE